MELTSSVFLNFIALMLPFYFKVTTHAAVGAMAYFNSKCFEMLILHEEDRVNVTHKMNESEAQFENCRNVLSHLFHKNYVKSIYSVPKLTE